MNANPLQLQNRSGAQSLYAEVVRTANYFLHNCRHFSVEVLQDEDPSYAEIARVMQQVAEIIRILSDDWDPMLSQKATEYCDLMRRMGIAVNEGDQTTLDSLVFELGRKPGI